MRRCITWFKLTANGVLIKVLNSGPECQVPVLKPAGLFLSFDIPYSGKIWRALNLAKWRKTAINSYWRDLNLATCTGVYVILI